MDRAPLRPVPSRPAGPVDPADAAAFVLQRLPALDADAANALARVEIAGHARAEGDAEALARARKQLRRSLVALPSSGWCERAERSMSDRLDGALEPPASTRLEAHLANCPRCVEHDLRLAQAMDLLLRDFALAYPGPPALAAVPDKPAEAPPLRAVGDAPEPVEARSGLGVPAVGWAVLIVLAIVLALAAAALLATGAFGANP
jgi:Putative zinc-finger